MCRHTNKTTETRREAWAAAACIGKSRRRCNSYECVEDSNVWRQRQQHLKRNHRLSQRRKQLVNNEIMAIIALVACLVAILHTLLQLQGQYYTKLFIISHCLLLFICLFIAFSKGFNAKFKYLKWLLFSSKANKKKWKICHKSRAQYFMLDNQPSNE